MEGTYWAASVTEGQSVDAIANLSERDYQQVNTSILTSSQAPPYWPKSISPHECDIAVTDGTLEFAIYGVLLNVVSLFGVMGNAVSMIILSRPQMKSSINYLLIGLARCDTILIILSVLVYGLPGIYPYTGYLFDYKFYVYPKIVRYLYPLSTMAHMAAVYLTLTVTMERYVAVCHPLRARSLCTYGRARTAVVSITLVSILYNLPKFWEVELMDEKHWRFNVTIYCIRATMLRESDIYIAVYVHWIYFFVYYAFPFAALVVFNAAIYKRVRKANRDLQHLSRHQRREIGLATMLLCVVIVFIICNFLPLVSNVYENIYGNPPSWIIQTGNLLVTINSSINFIIYVIFGRKFKRIFLKLFCSSAFFGPGRESPEFQTNDESVVTNTTNLELRNSIRRNHLHRSSTVMSRKKHGNAVNGAARHGTHIPLSSPSAPEAPAPTPCVYYPVRSESNLNYPNGGSNLITTGLNGWSNDLAGDPRD